jgi:AGZA family xanthine/uracil permease-like MFS transporter
VTRKIPGAIILVILALTLVGLTVPSPDGKGMITALPNGIVNLPASLAPTFLKLDLSYFWKNFLGAIPVVLSILFVDLFDNMGTLIGVSKRAGLLDKNGNLPKIGQAFMADAGAAMFGSSLGTSTVTSYIESAAGVEAGGRTRVDRDRDGLLFFSGLVLHAFDPDHSSVATAPALVIVGAFMMQGLAELDLRDFEKAAPAFITILAMPLAFSISEGIAFGLLTYVGLKLGTGKSNEVGAVTYVLAVLFILHFLFGR